MNIIKRLKKDYGLCSATALYFCLIRDQFPTLPRIPEIGDDDKAICFTHYSKCCARCEFFDICKDSKTICGELNNKHFIKNPALCWFYSKEKIEKL